MAKRMFDTGMYRKPFMKGLDTVYKLFWNYILLDCDHAGVWEVEIEIVNLRLGTNLTEEEVIEAFDGKIVDLGDCKWFVPSFISFQYGELRVGHRVHDSVIKRLNSLSICHKTLTHEDEVRKGFRNPLDRDKEKEKEKDMEKDMEKANPSKPSKGSVGKKIVPPGEDEFVSYLVEKMPEKVNEKWTKERTQRAASLLFERLSLDGWKDGNGNQVKNWKTKAVNILKHDKPWNYGDDSGAKTSSSTYSTPAEGPEGWQEAYRKLYENLDPPAFWAYLESEEQEKIKQHLNEKS